MGYFVWLLINYSKILFIISQFGHNYLRNKTKSFNIVLTFSIMHEYTCTIISVAASERATLPLNAGGNFKRSQIRETPN